MTSTEPPTPGPEERRRLVRSLVASAQADSGLSGLAAALQRVCRAATDSLELLGAAVHVMANGEGTGVLACSDAAARAVAELQFTANEGPALVAFRTQRPVLIPVLDGALDRWPGFSSLAMERGVHGVFSFPLQEGAVSFGVLDLYADGAAHLDRPGHAMGAAFAHVATDFLLDGDTITAAGDIDAGLSTSLADRSRIHQAQGMVMVDLGVTLADALSRMRARAFGAQSSLLEVADEVIAGNVAADTWINGDTTPDGRSA